MLHMSVDTRALERRLNSLAVSQVPFATSLGINEVASQIRDAEPRGLERDLDRPTPFTKKGLFVRRASKRKLTAVVGFKRIQAQYLGLQVKGGTRRPKARAIAVPVGARLNKYGNMPRGSMRKALAKPGTFSGTVNGVGGIWQRPKVRAGGGNGRRSKAAKKGVKLLAVYKSNVRYNPRLKFHPRARALAGKAIGPAIAKHLAQAVKTAR